MMQTKPFFIVGHERSGTTLMAVMMDRHSRVAVPPETHFFEQVCPIHKAHQRAAPEILVDQYFRSRLSQKLKLARQELLDRLDGRKSSWADLFRVVLNTYAVNHCKELYGEKTPVHYKIAPQLLELFPQSRMIWMFRDGRDVLLSLSKVPWKIHRILRVHAWEWRRSMEQMRQRQRQYPDRIIEVKFENLLTNPEFELNRVCQFLGIEFEPRQMNPEISSDVVMLSILFRQYCALGAIDSSRIGGWKRGFSPQQQSLLNSVMQPCLSQFGYLTDDLRNGRPKLEKLKNDMANLLCRSNLSWYRSVAARHLRKHTIMLDAPREAEASTQTMSTLDEVALGVPAAIGESGLQNSS